MTCIVGVVDDGKVYMGADSASGSNDWEVRTSLIPKLFYSGKHFLIGYTSSWRMGQILEHHLKIDEKDLPKAGDSAQGFMVGVFIEEVRKVLGKYGYAEKEHNRESGGEILVGFRGNLFHVESDYQVNQAADGYDACGCGSKYALGSLYESSEPSAQEKVLTALTTACHFSGGVRPPMHIETLE